MRVVVLRGTAANPWELRAWTRVGAPYEVAVAVAGNNQYDLGDLPLERIPVRTMSAKLRGPALKAVGERYLGLEDALRGADVVHTAELGYWFAVQAARLKRELGFRLVTTVWETIPFKAAYRNVRTRRYVPEVLRETDLFLATTDRAAAALRLEGAAPERIRVAPPGIDVDAFAPAREPRPPADASHVVLSVARLVWEKGHQDVLRAVAQLGRDDVRVVIVGQGPERDRLQRYARELGVRAELRGGVPYDALPALYAQASCLVLASLPTMHWEEQFGMVLAEAMAAHLPIVAARSGAIPEVVGASGTLFTAGDWLELAGVLPLDGPPAARRAPEPERLASFSLDAAGARLRAAYDEVLGA